ncbi:GNAT family N-acetyltransferase [Flavobacterium sp.]|jgi:RimJ/RimL family protein N-acetyltransferase|uniref:GNAT family N-acetyltransferase n=1 Tax=Flavobacterium sp. TaxID=239 RepID=UPI0037BF254B
MSFVEHYKVLTQQKFQSDNFSLVPIRFEDRLKIMHWRNEQLYHLRQQKPLAVEDQENYFKNVVSKLFHQEQPNQILFSFLENGFCIGYGGLVHINWTDRNAEISFIMDTALEDKRFHEIWKAYLNLLEQVAFTDLNLHKIYTYAFDLRPHLYDVLEACSFMNEARLKEHCFFRGEFLDIIYHSKINRKMLFREAKEKDSLLFFEWANDASVRDNSYQSEPISIETHNIWFLNKLRDDDCFMTVFENHIGDPIGQVRIQRFDNEKAMIGISSDVKHRGKGYAFKMIQMASEVFLKENPQSCISAYIKLENLASQRAFEKAGYKLDKALEYDSIPSLHYIRKL